MIANLNRLTTLSIQARRARIAQPSTVWRCLSQLSYLRKMDLSFAESEEWLFDLQTEVADLDSLFSESSSDSSRLPIIPQLRPVAQTFKSLEWLRLAGGRPKLRNSHFEHFPPSLTLLNVAACDEVDSGMLLFASKLRNLTSLSFPERKHSCETRTDPPLPPNITSLYVYSRSNAAHATSALWSKHRSLTALSACIELSQLIDLPLLKKLSLQTRTFNSSKNISFAHLPNLVDLTYPQVIMPEIVATIPFIATSLDLAIGAKDLSSFQNFPKLTNLSLRSGEVAAEHLEQLPETLTNLRLRGDGLQRQTALDSCAAKLPRGLTVLHLASPGVFDLSCLQDLPKSLTDLEVQLYVPSLSTPSTLQHIANMPPHLRFLSFFHDSSYAGHEKRNANGIRSVPGWTPEMLVQLANVAPALSSLRFWNMPPSIWTAEHCGALPRQLRFLLITQCGLLNSSISSLPASLKDIYFVHREPPSSTPDALSTECFKYLPRRLRSLSIDGYLRSVSQAHAADLPPTLTRFNCESFYRETEPALSLFPRDCYLELPSYSTKMELARLANKNATLPLFDPDPRVLSGEITW